MRTSALADAIASASVCGTGFIAAVGAKIQGHERIESMTTVTCPACWNERGEGRESDPAHLCKACRKDLEDSKR